MSENNQNNTAETLNETEPQESCSVIGIRFRPCGKIYTFEANDLDVKEGTQVIVESEMGLSIGFVARSRYETRRTNQQLKKVLRAATDEDFATLESNKALEQEAKAFCAEKARDYNLDMKVVTTESTLDKKRLVFYFTADGRIDFRELVRDLASKFKTRIEMRQIGVRDEVKLLGGIGACGRQACCSLFLTSFEPITIKMAKQQDLSINQSKLSGICGRLMCCLGYEYRENGEKYAPAERRCRRGPAKTTEQAADVPASPVQEKTAETAADSTARDTRTDTAVPETEKPQPAGAEIVTPADTGQKAEKERPSKRRRRRRKKKPSAGTSQEKPAPKQSAADAGPSKDVKAESLSGERKEKGRPFSKRRKFWKKKKQ